MRELGAPPGPNYPMRIANAASAFPKNTYDQATISGALSGFWRDQLPNPDFLDRLHGRTGVDCRYTVMPLQSYVRANTFGKTNNIWIENAQELGSEAICKAITPLGLEPKDLVCFFFRVSNGRGQPFD